MKQSIFMAISVAILLSGCVKDVKPWEKNALAKPTMQESGTNPILNQFEKHIYFSKEASRGGSSISGGGCGCN